MTPGFRMTMAADAGDVAKVQAAFGEFAERHALGDEIRRSMLVVLDELVANIVSHGLAGVNGGTATIDVQLHPGHLDVTLTDNGVPFDPLRRETPDTSLSVEDRPIGGLGIHLVRQMVDDVRYERRDDKNVLTLVKQLDQKT